MESLDTFPEELDLFDEEPEEEEPFDDLDPFELFVVLDEEFVEELFEPELFDDELPEDLLELELEEPLFDPELPELLELLCDDELDELEEL